MWKTTGTQTNVTDERRRFPKHSGRGGKQDDKHAEWLYLLIVFQTLTFWLSPHSHVRFSKIVVDPFHHLVLPLECAPADSTSEHVLDSVFEWFFSSSRNARWYQDSTLSRSVLSHTRYAAERSRLLDRLTCSLRCAVRLESGTVNFEFGIERF